MLYLDRFLITNNGCLGFLYSEEQSICFTLERSDVSCARAKSYRIPDGKYGVLVTQTSTTVSTHFSRPEGANNRIVKYAPLLYNKQVPKDRGIRIHVGNNENHTAGCVLVGLEVVFEGRRDLRLIQNYDAPGEQKKAIVKFLSSPHFSDPSVVVPPASLMSSKFAMNRLALRGGFMGREPDGSLIDGAFVTDKPNQELSVQWLQS